MAQPIRDLYDLLYDKKMYTKTFDDFYAKYGNEEGMNALYDQLKSKKAYTNDINQFKDKYYAHLKKKDNSGQDSPSSENQMGSGSQSGFRTIGSPKQPLRQEQRELAIENFDTGLKTDEEKFTDQVNSMYGDNNPSSRIQSYNIGLLPLKTKYDPLLASAKSQEETNKLLSEYDKERESLASSYGLELKDGNVSLNPEEKKFWENEYRKAWDGVMAERKKNEKDPFVKDVINKLYVGGSRDIMMLPYRGFALMEKVGNAAFSPLGVPEGNKWKEFVDYNDELFNELSQQSNRYDEEAMSMLQQGNVAGALGKTILNVTESIPMMTTLVLGNMAGATKASTYLIGASKSSQEYQLLDRTTDLPEYMKMLSSIAKGMNEVSFVNWGTVSILNGVKKQIAAQGADVVKKELTSGYAAAIQKSIAPYLGNSAREAASEMATQISDNLVDVSTGNKNIDQIFEGVADAGMAGGLMGLGFTAPVGVNDAVGYFNNLTKSIPSEYPAETKVEIIKETIKSDNLKGKAKKATNDGVKSALEKAAKESDVIIEDIIKSEEGLLEEKAPTEAPKSSTKPSKTTESIKVPAEEIKAENVNIEAKNETPKQQAEKPKEEPAKIEPVQEAQQEEITQVEPIKTEEDGKQTEVQAQDQTETVTEDVLPQDDLSATMDKYNWKVSKDEKGNSTLVNAKGKQVATIKGKDGKYSIFDNAGTKLLSGNNKVFEGAEKVARDYFYAKQKEDAIPNTQTTGETGVEATPKEGDGGVQQVRVRDAEQTQGRSPIDILETEIKKTKKDKLSAKEEEIKNRIAERMQRLSGAKLAVGEEGVDTASDIVGLVKDLGELGLIKIEQGVDHVITELKKYIPNATQEDLDKYRKDIEPIIPIPDKDTGDQDQIGIKRSMISDDVIAESGIQRRSIDDMMRSGMDAVDSGRIDPTALADDVIANPRPLNTDEISSLIYKKTMTDNAIDSAFNRLDEANSAGDIEQQTAINAEIKDLYNLKDKIDEAAVLGTNRQGQAFRLLQAVMNKDYTYESQTRRYKAINNGVVPKEIDQKFREYDAQIRDINRKLQKVEEENQRLKTDSTLKDGAKRKQRVSKPKLSTEESFESAVTKGLDKGLAWLDDIDKKLTEFGRETLGVNLPVAVAQTGIKAAKIALKAGKTVSEAIDAAIEAIRKSDWYKNAEDSDKGEAESLVRGLFSGKGEVSAPRVADDKINIPNDLIRDYVEKGIDNINDLVSAIKSDYGLEASERDIRDAITRYGQTMEMSKEEIDVTIRKMKRLGRLISGLEDIKEKQQRPQRSGLQRDKLSDEERRMQSQIKEAMKELPVSDEDMQKSWASTLDGIKTRLKNQIKDLDHQIKTGERSPKKVGIQYDAEAESLRQQRDELRAVIRNIDGRPELTDEQKVRRAIASTERLIKEYERRIQEKDFSPMNEAGNTPVTEQLQAARDRLNELKETYSKLKDSEGVTDKVRLERLKSRLQNSIEAYQEKIKSGDFSKKKKQEVKMDAEAMRLQVEKEKIKLQYDTEIEKARLKNRTQWQKTKDTLVDVLNLPKALLATADFSAPLRQGAILSFGNPMTAIRSGKTMFVHALYPEEATKWLTALRASDEYVVMKQSGLYLSEPTARLSAKEEQFMTNLAHKIPFYRKIVGASERAYVGYLNKLRSDVFIHETEYLKSIGVTQQNSPESYKALADFINNATGRGSLGGLEKAATTLNGLAFAPRLVASRINLLNPVKYAKMPAPVRRMAMRNMLVYMGAGMTILSLAALAGADVELDPRSADFGKIKLGNLRFDIWAGFQQPIRMMSQVLSGKTKSSTSGVIRKLGPDGFPGTTRLDVIGRFARGKLSPTPSLAIDLLKGETMMGEDITWERYTVEMVAPLYLQDVFGIAREEGLGRTAAAATAAMFGVGVQHYGETNPARRAVDQGLTLEDAYEFKKANQDDPITDKQKSDISKQYKIYSKYGLDNEDVNYLMQKGITNENKALYLVMRKYDEKATIPISEYRKTGVISSDLYEKFIDAEKEYKKTRK